jgi:CheY-like chemotaxis protein|nr:response regulator [uncultured Flavobacterium sp.]
MKYTKIYMADDDPDDRELFMSALEEVSKDLSLVMFHNGLQLISDLASPSRILPDIIFLDINMPFKNGIESLSDIRSNPLTARIPVIIYSTSNDPDLIAKTRSLGATLYAVKPSDYTKLKQLLIKTLSDNWKKPSAVAFTDNFIIS